MQPAPTLVLTHHTKVSIHIHCCGHQETNIASVTSEASGPLASPIWWAKMACDVRRELEHGTHIRHLGLRVYRRMHTRLVSVAKYQFAGYLGRLR